jgi:putative FmdB family regulatory protein
VDDGRLDGASLAVTGVECQPGRTTRSSSTVPTYQYVCTNPEVKHEFEVVQSFSDPAVATCPECGAQVRKVYGSVGVVFKGSGFYRTDSRKAESSTASAPSKESSSTSGNGSSGNASTSSTSASTSASPSTSGSSGKAAN